MKRPLTAVSLVGNIALVAGLLWLRADHQGELREMALIAMRGDELHLQLHASSLAAIEAPDSEEAIAAADMLRHIIAVGEINIEARRSAGLGE